MYRLARRENRTEAYEIREAGREPASSFYARMAMSDDDDIDLEAIIREEHQLNHNA